MNYDLWQTNHGVINPQSQTQVWQVQRWRSEGKKLNIFAPEWTRLFEFIPDKRRPQQNAEHNHQRVMAGRHSAVTNPIIQVKPKTITVNRNRQKLGTRPGLAPAPSFYLCKWRPSCPLLPHTPPKTYSYIRALLWGYVSGWFTLYKQTGIPVQQRENGCGFGHVGRRWDGVQRHRDRGRNEEKRKGGGASRSKRVKVVIKRQ